MRTARFPTVYVLVAATRCQYQRGVDIYHETWDTHIPGYTPAGHTYPLDMPTPRHTHPLDIPALPPGYSHPY